MAREFTCTEEGCTFRVRANEEDEVVRHVRDHAHETHDMDLSDGQIREGIRDA